MAQIAFGSFAIDLDRECLLRDGDEVKLRPQSFRMLRYLIENSNRLLTKAELMDALWSGLAVTDDSLVQCLRDVRLALDDRGHSLIKTVPRRGYLFTLRPNLPSAIPVREELPLPEKPSIAIPPFTNLSAAPDQDYFADGIRLDIQSALVHASGLFLVAAATSNKYRDAGVTADRAAREMGVRYILQGAVQRSDRQIRVSVQLIDALAGRIVWAEQYDRVFEDGFALQDEITTEILKALDVTLTGGEKWLLHSFPWNLKALDLFYRGLSHYYAGTQKDNAVAREMFESVMRLQPESSIGPAYLCFAYWADVFRGWAESREQSLAQAARLAEQALNFKGPNNGLPHLVLALVHLVRHEHEQALAECYEGVETRPNCPTAHIYLGNILHYCGRSSEAIPKIKDAMRISPIYPTWYLTLLAAAYRESGDLDRSIAEAGRAVELSPNDRDALLVLCSDYGLAGQWERARQLAEGVVRIDPAFSIAKYAEGQPYRNKETLDRLTESYKRAGLPA